MDQAETTRWIRAAQLLEQVLDLPMDEQAAAVAELGRANGVLEELEGLLAGSRGASVLDGSVESFLSQMPGSSVARNAYKGQILGAWVVGEEIGQGGMSVVYHAQRTGQDFEQHAALKILSVAGLGDDLVDSFVRERQILSDLQHPGIARLIDGGITPDGAPFLVMQYVDGQRIDNWCRDNGASLKTIVRLMLKLCDATAYAQRRLVVHQDINPTNVLVDEHNQPILIDFGIAKLLGPASKSETLRAFTARFAAPEQTAGGAITTATDAYALGKLLLELAGNHPLDSDLEAIARVATQDDPEQRYPNARALALDLQAWLDKRPVQARPATVRYRAGRFIARHRLPVTAAAVIMMSIIGGLGLAIWQARIAAQERDVAQAESARAGQVTEFLKDLFRASDPDRAQGEEVTARELLDQGGHQVRHAFNGAPDLKAEMMVLLGNLYRELGELDSANPLLEEGLEVAKSQGDDSLQVDAMRALAQARMESGEYEEALQLVNRAEDMLRTAGKIPGRQHAALMQPILFTLAELGRVPEAVERGQAALDTARADTDLAPEALYDYLNSVANVMLIAERPDDAESLLRDAATMKVDRAHDPTKQITLHSNLAGVLERKGDLEAGLVHRREALAITEQIYPPGHSERARMQSNLGSSLSKLGRYQEAQGVLRQALAIYDRIYHGEPNPRVAAAENNLGRALQQAGQYADAEAHVSKARDLARELFGADDPRFLIATGNLGDLERQLGHLDQADSLLSENLELRRNILGPDHRAVGNALSLLAALRLDQGQYEAALQLSDEALALFQRINYKNPRALTATLTRRAQALAGLGRDEEAEAGFADAMQMGETAGVDAGRSWPNLLTARAEFLVDRGEEAAGDALQRALEANLGLFGPDHPITRHVEALIERYGAAPRASGQRARTSP
ncbi:MAG: tetratricopeptide repeat protein [Lysobacterales bacterium]|jgi:serine/threonine-protein kinase